MSELMTYRKAPDVEVAVLEIREDNKEEVWELIKNVPDIDRKSFDNGYKYTIGEYAIIAPDGGLNVISKAMVKSVFKEAL